MRDPLNDPVSLWKIVNNRDTWCVTVLQVLYLDLALVRHPHSTLHATYIPFPMVSNEELDPLDLTLIAGNVALVAGSDILEYGAHFAKIAKHMSNLTGQQWCDELLAGHNDQFYNELRMRKHVFDQLLSVLDRDANLSGSWHITAIEQLCIFLHYARRGLSNRALQEQFQWSGDTITKYDLIMEYLTYETMPKSDASTACLMH